MLLQQTLGRIVVAQQGSGSRQATDELEQQALD
jgi:hypothetical protein